MFSGKLLAAATCCLLLFAGSSAGADSPSAGRKRVESQSYDGPSSALAVENEGYGFYTGVCNPGPTDDTEGCVYFDLSPKDRFISLRIEDLSGRPVYAIAWDDSDSDFVEFCGKTKKPVPSPGGEFFYVEIIATSNRLGCYPSTVTQGTVTATFLRQRK
ncbi:MAG: hypothetical protein ACRDJV_06370 [Actinomycetota bacterium]